jgi:hypothetical protein
MGRAPTKARPQVKEGACMDTANVPSDFLDLLPVGVFQTDIKLVLRYANKPAYEIFGYAPDDIGPTFNVMRLFVPTELPKLTMYTGKLLAGHPDPPAAMKPTCRGP